jgi:D-alanyl-D-alanine dipeptidase
MNNHHNLVNVTTLIPAIDIDIRYATSNNFTHKIIYPTAQAYLIRNAAEALKKASDEFNTYGYTLRIWDAYRPLQAQYIFWQLVPDERYVADPAKGSRHNRGCAVDITLLDTKGNEIDMGTDFDDFTQRAHRDCTDLSPDVLHNRKLLQDVMERNQFIGWKNEWWHFDFEEWEQYPILDIPLEHIG